MMAVQALKTEVVFNDKMLNHLRVMQDGENSIVDTFIEHCEEMGTLLLDISTGTVTKIDDENILDMLRCNNMMRQMLKDFRIVETK